MTAKQQTSSIESATATDRNRFTSDICGLRLDGSNGSFSDSRRSAIIGHRKCDGGCLQCSNKLAVDWAYVYNLGTLPDDTDRFVRIHEVRLGYELSAKFGASCSRTLGQ